MVFADPAERSRAIFAEAAKVLTHPRCMNWQPNSDGGALGGRRLRTHEKAPPAGERASLVNAAMPGSYTGPAKSSSYAGRERQEPAGARDRRDGRNDRRRRAGAANGAGVFRDSAEVICEPQEGGKRFDDREPGRDRRHAAAALTSSSKSSRAGESHRCWQHNQLMSECRVLCLKSPPASSNWVASARARSKNYAYQN
jgi:hypothetical protein